MFVSEICVLFFEKNEVIFTTWWFIFVLFFDKSDYDHCMHGRGGACVVVGGVHGCQGVCMAAGACVVMGGMSGYRGCVVAGGCVWLQGGMHGCGGCVWLWGACMVAGGHACLGGCIGYDKI